MLLNYMAKRQDVFLLDRLKLKLAKETEERQKDDEQC